MWFIAAPPNIGHTHYVDDIFAETKTQQNNNNDEGKNWTEAHIYRARL